MQRSAQLRKSSQIVTLKKADQNEATSVGIPPSQESGGERVLRETVDFRNPHDS